MSLRPTDDPTVYPFEALREHGLLWLINRMVFNSMGLTLALDYPKGTTSEQIITNAIEPTGWMMLGDGSEVFTMGDRLDEANFANAMDFIDGHRELGRVKAKIRELGFDSFESMVESFNEFERVWVAGAGNPIPVTDGDIPDGA